uniref:Uncharacterized protein n=1 Tax=Arundo donax TaxID=35708 RepID=A0A0A9BCK4_ARUDO
MWDMPESSLRPMSLRGRM